MPSYQRRPASENSTPKFPEGFALTPKKPDLPFGVFFGAGSGRRPSGERVGAAVCGAGRRRKERAADGAAPKRRRTERGQAEAAGEEAGRVGAGGGEHDGAARRQAVAKAGWNQWRGLDLRRGEALKS